MTGSGVPASWDPWTYSRDAAMAGRTDVAGFAPDGADGTIATVQRATYDARSSYVVVDAGPWIFGDADRAVYPLRMPDVDTSVPPLVVMVDDRRVPPQEEV